MSAGLSSLKLQLECLVCFGSAGEDDQARGLFVKPLNDAERHGALSFRLDAVGHLLHEGASAVVRIRDTHDAGRFVHHDHVAIEPNDDIVVDAFHRLPGRIHRDADHATIRYGGHWFSHDVAIHAHLARTDQFAQLIPGCSLVRVTQGSIERAAFAGQDKLSLEPRHVLVHADNGSLADAGGQGGDGRARATIGGTLPVMDSGARWCWAFAALMVSACSLNRDGQSVVFGEPSSSSSAATGGGQSSSLTTVGSSAQAQGSSASAQSSSSAGGMGGSGPAASSGAGGAGGQGPGVGGQGGGTPVVSLTWNSWTIDMANKVVSAEKMPMYDAALFFHESVNATNLDGGNPFDAFSQGGHPGGFNASNQWWRNQGDYPYVGRSAVGRGMGSGESNALMPLNVNDLQAHPPDSSKLAVVAFEAPVKGDYTVTSFSARRVHFEGNQGAVVLRHPCKGGTVFDTLNVTNNRAWVHSNGVHAIGPMDKGDRICFGVGRGNDGYGWDAIEMAWVIEADVD